MSSVPPRWRRSFHGLLFLIFATEENENKVQGSLDSEVVRALCREDRLCLCTRSVHVSNGWEAKTKLLTSFLTPLLHTPLSPSLPVPMFPSKSLSGTWRCRCSRSIFHRGINRLCIAPHKAGHERPPTTCATTKHAHRSPPRQVCSPSPVTLW